MTEKITSLSVPGAFLNWTSEPDINPLVSALEIVEKVETASNTASNAAASRFDIALICPPRLAPAR